MVGRQFFKSGLFIKKILIHITHGGFRESLKSPLEENDVSS